MYFCWIAQILPVRHETSINQSIICPPNVDSTMWLILAGTPYTLECNALRSVMLRGIKVTIRIYHNVRFKVNLFERLRTIHMMSSHKSQWRMRIVDSLGLPLNKQWIKYMSLSHNYEKLLKFIIFLDSQKTWNQERHGIQLPYQAVCTWSKK